jgi:hypothetical protein
MPKFGPGRASLHCDTKVCCLRVRSGSGAGILSPPAPRSPAGPTHLFRVRFNPPTLFGPVSPARFFFG